MNRLIEIEQNNPELQNTIDVQTILESAENVDNNYIGEHSLKTISKEIFDTLQESKIDNDTLYKYCDSLLHYRLIEHVYHIHKGKHIRWLRDNKLTNGGIVVDVKFLDNGTHILCKNRNRFIQYKFDDCLTFQKLTTDELLILQLIDSA
jgi:hypothetical protein